MAWLQNVIAALVVHAIALVAVSRTTIGRLERHGPGTPILVKTRQAWGRISESILPRSLTRYVNSCGYAPRVRFQLTYPPWSIHYYLVVVVFQGRGSV